MKNYKYTVTRTDYFSHYKSTCTKYYYNFSDPILSNYNYSKFYN